MIGDCVNAKPRAVPRKGAVHGVARTVANTPWKNEPRLSLRSELVSKPRLILCGSEISKTPKRFSAQAAQLGPQRSSVFQAARLCGRCRSKISKKRSAPASPTNSCRAIQLEFEL